MLRVLFALLLLFSLRPDVAAASCVLPDADEHSRYVSADPTSGGHGAFRSSSGVELLAEVTSRMLSRAPTGERQPLVRRFRDGLARPESDLLAILPRHVVETRARDLQCAASPFVVYLPYHANPPPPLA